MTAPSETGPVRRKALRMLRARRQRVSPWRALLHVGVLGWVFVLPVVLGVVGGRLVELHLGLRGATLGGLLLGVVAGAYAAWRQIRQSLAEGDDEEEPP